MNIWAQRLYYQSARSLQILFCYSLSPALPDVPLSSLSTIILLCLPSCIRATASVVPSSTVTNWHAEFSTGTLNPRDQAYRESSFISFPFGNCLCSSRGALGGFQHKGRMSHISNLLLGYKKEGKKNFTSWDQRTDEDNWGFMKSTTSRHLFRPCVIAVVSWCTLPF